MKILSINNYNKQQANKQNINFKAKVTTNLSDELISYFTSLSPIRSVNEAQRFMDSVDFTKRVAPNLGTNEQLITYTNLVSANLGEVQMRLVGHPQKYQLMPDSDGDYLDDTRYVLSDLWHHWLPTYGKISVENEYRNFCSTLSRYEPVKGRTDIVKHMLVDGSLGKFEKIHMGEMKVSDIFDKAKTYLHIDPDRSS